MAIMRGKAVQESLILLVFPNRHQRSGRRGRSYKPCHSDHFPGQFSTVSARIPLSGRLLVAGISGSVNGPWAARSPIHFGGTRVNWWPSAVAAPRRGHDISHTVDPGHRPEKQDMNAPPNIDPVTASDVVHWLTNDTRDERFIDNIFAELCLRLQRAGIPVKRASLHILIHHPQWLGARMMWADGMREAELARVDYDVRGRSEYIGSPANEIYDGATEVRENLERDPSLGRQHAVYDEMRAKGLTDYVAWPLYHTLGKRHIVTFATDRPGGFD